MKPPVKKPPVKKPPVKPPVIESVGPPPDQHAERIVSEMLRFMHRGRSKLTQKYAKGLINVHTMGGPEGQRRTVNRLRGAIGPLLLEIGLAPAKRGKFTLLISEWSLWDPKKFDMIHADEPAPMGNAWLAVMTSTYTGANYLPKVRRGVSLIISYHAMVRLCQRAGVRTISDMIVAVRKLWGAVDGVMGRFEPESSDWLRPPDGSWLVELPVEGKPLAVLAPTRRSMARSCWSRPSSNIVCLTGRRCL